MVKVNWTDHAINNLNEIGDFIALDSHKYAELTVNRLFDATIILETFPLTGRIVPELNKTEIRELVRLNNYRIVYRIVNKTRIDILTVHHSSRLLKNNPIIKKNR